MDWFIKLPLPLMVGISVAIEIGIILLILFILRAFGANILRAVTRTVWLQGLKNLFFTLLFTSAFVAAIVLVAVFGFGQSMEYSFYISLCVFLVTISCFSLFTWFFNRLKAGHILLDVIPVPNRSTFFITGGYFVLIGSLVTSEFFWRGRDFSWPISILIGLFIALPSFIMGCSRIQIRENGITAYTNLIEWVKIESFEWVDEDKNATIKLRYKGRLPTYLRNGAISIPIEKKSAVDTLLKNNLQNVEKSA